MKSNKAKIMALAASAALVAMLGLAACGGGSSSSSASASASASASTSASASASASAAASASASASASAAAASSSASASSAGVVDNVDTSKMLAYMGVSDQEETFYWAIDDASDEGILAVLDPKTGRYASFVGPITSPSETQLTITDKSTGDSLTFEVTAADADGNMVIDMGEQGKAILAPCKIEEVAQALAIIAENGTEVNPASASASASASSANTANWECYMGMSTANEAYYLAMDANSTEGILVILNDKGNYLSFVGPIVISDNQMQITDETTGDKFGFELKSGDGEGKVILDAGEAAGEVTLEKCTFEEVAEALAKIDANGKAVN